MALEYIDTKKVCKAGTTSLVYLKKQWNFSKGDVVDLRVRHHESEGEWFLGTRRVCRYGTGVAVFLDKAWGFTPGEMVEIHVTRRDSS
jgi:hypothetical protein